MRTGWKLTASALTIVTLAGCGSDGDADSSSDTTTVTTPAVTTTVASSTPAAAATTTAATTTTAAPTTTAVAGPGAPVQLGAFLSAYEVLTNRLQGVLDDVQGDIDSTSSVSDAVSDETNDVAGDVFDLTRLVPLGLDPSVYTAVHNSVMVMGAATGAYLYAPGFDTAEWPDWRPAMEAAMAQLDTQRAEVVSSAAAEPAMASVDDKSRDAAEGAMLTLELGRRFGHAGPGAEFDASVPFIHWIGSLPTTTPDGTQCYFDADAGVGRVPTGDFVDGVGGCAVVFYDGIDHAEEIDAWKADQNQLPTGEFVAFAYLGGAWQAGGSVE